MPSVSHWLVTGAAGFIGSHLVEELLRRDQVVRGLDNLSTGRMSNLEDVRRRVGAERWSRFTWMEGDIARPSDVERAVAGAEYVLHQAALGSVPKSVEDPRTNHESNVTGFLNMLLASRAAGVRRVVYASSSAVYGDCTESPAREERIGAPLSPYAVSKRMDEEYADVFARCYGFEAVGLRYFNVFGPRQDPNGAYAAVIPRWIDALIAGRTVEIYGDGETTRDFCPVENIVHANLLAAVADLPREAPRVFNVGLGGGTTLNTLFGHLRDEVARSRPEVAAVRPAYGPFRAGDVRHSCADASRIREWLGFKPVKDLATGLAETARWFANAHIPA